MVLKIAGMYDYVSLVVFVKLDLVEFIQGAAFSLLLLMLAIPRRSYSKASTTYLTKYLTYVLIKVSFTTRLTYEWSTTRSNAQQQDVVYYLNLKILKINLYA